MADYYASPTGSGSACTLGSPCLLSVGKTKGGPGDTLYLRQGNHIGINSTSGNFPTISAGSSWNSPYTIKNYPSETATILVNGDGEFCMAIEDTSYVVLDGLVFDGTSAINCIKIRLLAHHIRVQNSEVKNSDSSGILLPDESPSNTVQGFDEFINLQVHNCGTYFRYDHGIYSSVPSVLIEHCTFYNNAAFGIQVSNGVCDNTIVRYNITRNNLASSTNDEARCPGCVVGGFDGGGIFVSHGTSDEIYDNLSYNNGIGLGMGLEYSFVDPLVYNNTFYGNGADGLYCYSGTGGFVRNNISYGNGASMTLESTHNITVQNNLTQSAIGRVADSGTTLSGNLIGNPLFTNAASNLFTLLAGSPAIGAALDESSIFTTDYAGATRTVPWDIGAYKYTFPGTLQTVLTGKLQAVGNVVFT